MFSLRETRQWAEYALVVAKGGSKLKEPDAGLGDGINRGCGVMKGTRTTMSNLAMVLPRQLERPVLDRTGLGGRYDFELSYTPESGCGARQPDGIAANGDPLTDRPSPFTAIQDQLGLIVTDRTEKPEAN